VLNKHVNSYLFTYSLTHSLWVYSIAVYVYCQKEHISLYLGKRRNIFGMKMLSLVIYEVQVWGLFCV